MDSWVEISERYDRKYRKIRVLSEQQNHRCCYCGVHMLIARKQKDFDLPNTATIEHVIPQIQGGERGYHNEVAACRLCNNVRSADDAYEFYEWRLQHLADTPSQLQKAIGRLRRDKLKAEAAVRKATTQADRQAAANKVPVYSRLMNLALRHTIEYIHHIMVRVHLATRKYRQPKKVADTNANSRGGPRHHGRRSRARHRAKNLVGNTNTGIPQCQEQTGI